MNIRDKVRNLVKDAQCLGSEKDGKKYYVVSLTGIDGAEFLDKDEAWEDAYNRAVLKHSKKIKNV